MFSAYIIHLLIIIGIFLILSISLNLTIGFTGLLNLGHIAFFGIGAYTSALLTLAGVPWLISFLLAGIFAAAFSFILIFVTKNLKGDYLALTTLGFAFVVYSVLLNWSSLTRGPLGIPGIPKPRIDGLVFSTNQIYLVLIVVVTVIVYLILYRLVSSRYGRLLEGVRDDEIGLSVLGKNVFRLKYQSMMIASFFAGLAGSLYAHYITYIDPSTFYLDDLILVLTIVIVGGLASLRGTVLASFIILLVPEVLRFVELPSSIIGPGRRIIYALILILILIYKPRGIDGKVDLE
ncbi:branched-chain amino acid ABC transporter permease [Patescibacteria group bacterium]